MSQESPAKHPRRAAYALPMLFTAGNVFLGFLSILKSFEGGLAAASGNLGYNRHFELAAIAIGLAVVLDGLDGRIARLTGTTSDFGREMDSLADVISFGLAPAVLALAWGAQFVDGGIGPVTRDYLRRFASFVGFLFLLCAAVRLARFNVQKNPVPKNPGREDRKYFVGLPTPPAAGLVAAVVYAAGSAPVTFWLYSVLWLILLAIVSFLMVSTWRYRSLKDVQLLRPLSPLTVVVWGAGIYLIWNFSRPVLLAIAVAYVGSGIVIRVGGVLKRRFHRDGEPAGARAGVIR